jgi:phage tail-like protein
MRFCVKWDGKRVAGVSKVSALKRKTEPVKFRSGCQPGMQLVFPSIWDHEPITLERGVTHDPEFEAWANKVWNMEADGGISLKDFRKDLTIELLNEQGKVAKAYKVYRAWVSEYQALPELDANAHAVAIEHMVLQNEGWERDLDVVEPTET